MMVQVYKWKYQVPHRRDWCEGGEDYKGDALLCGDHSEGVGEGFHTLLE